MEHDWDFICRVQLNEIDMIWMLYYLATSALFVSEFLIEINKFLTAAESWAVTC